MGWSFTVKELNWVFVLHWLLSYGLLSALSWAEANGIQNLSVDYDSLLAIQIVQNIKKWNAGHQALILDIQALANVFLAISSCFSVYYFS